MIEVELKFPVESLDETRHRLMDLGATPRSFLIQTDEYLNDPLRDFAKLDMALRIRRSDDQYVLTFKGPNLDSLAKIRQEIELPLSDESAAGQLKQVFEGIGFFSVAKVLKRREELSLKWNDKSVKICLDDVKEVGGFVELELVVENESKMSNQHISLKIEIQFWFNFKMSVYIAIYTVYYWFQINMIIMTTNKYNGTI